jgi:hypothetical protein
MPKAPAFQFYAAEWLADENVAIMTLEEEGAYIRAISYCWREGSIPSSPELLSRLCKGASTTVIGVVIACFKQHPNDPNRLIHGRLEIERAKQESWKKKSSDGGKKGADIRWGPEKERVAKPKHDQPVTTPITTISEVVKPVDGSSFSSLSSSSKGGAQANEPPKNPPPAAPPDDGEMPEGLNGLEYARGLMDRCNIPLDFQTQRPIAAAIEAYAKQRSISLPKATMELIRFAEDALREGATVNRFWFTDGKYRAKMQKRPVVKVPDAAERQMAEDAARMQQQQALTRSVQ